MRHMNGAVALTSALVLLLAAVIFVTVTGTGHGGWRPLLGMLVAWVVFVAAAISARRLPARHIPALIVAGSLLLGAVAVAAPPVVSSDSARYAWDGIVQKAGISPYRYAPADPALAGLRPEWLFRVPAPGANCHGAPFPTGTVVTTSGPETAVLCTAINRPQVHTVYPAVAELYFLAVRLLPGADVGFIAFQLAGLVLSLTVTVMLLRFLRRSGRPAHQAVWWAWCPLVAFEAVNGAHVDVLGAVLAAAAALLLAGGKPLRSGVAFGAAVATKLIPALLAPAMLYRKPLRFTVAASATFLVAYLPFLAVSGAAVLGYLPGYLQEEGYAGGSSARFALLQLVLPSPWELFAGLALLLCLAVWVWRHTDQAKPWDSQVLMIGGTLLLVSPGYPWYALLLVPFVVMSRRYEYLAIPPVLTVMYLGGSMALDQALLAVSVAAIAIVGWFRQRRVNRPVRRPGPSRRETRRTGSPVPKRLCCIVSRRNRQGVGHVRHMPAAVQAHASYETGRDFP